MHFNSEQLLSRLPNIELSYETISHKKVSSEYDICLAIPQSKKFHAYFSFLGNRDVCYLMELTREKKIGTITIAQTVFHPSLALGTFLYGSLIEFEPKKYHFLIEDIFMYKGISLRNTTFGHKLGFIYEFLKNTVIQKFEETIPDMQYNIVFVLPNIWNITDSPSAISYPIHHLQYRSLTVICPFLNVFPKPINILNESTISNSVICPVELMVNTTKKYIPDFAKPQYRQKTIFKVSADLQNDIYHLYAYGKNRELIYYEYAYIHNYKVSAFMNGLFRNIKENTNLDYIEESEDECDFQDVSYGKYVDLTKQLVLECSFHKKFKRWTPIRLIQGQNEKVVHISKLVRNYI